MSNSINKGDRFRVFGADSTGEVVSVGGATVSYRFDHAPEKVYGHELKQFLKFTYPA